MVFVMIIKENVRLRLLVQLNPLILILIQNLRLHVYLGNDRCALDFIHILGCVFFIIRTSISLLFAAD